MDQIKQLIFAVIRYSGIYRFVRHFYRRKLLILCYHGISVDDEHDWWPGVFMSAKKFQSRMSLVRSMGFNPLTLGAAVEGLQNNTLPDYPVVVTADDGYLNSPETLLETCNECELPLTIYVTSYHSQKGSPVFNVAIQYLFWKASGARLRGPLPDYFGDRCSDSELILNEQTSEELSKNIIDYGREELHDAGRSQLIEEVARVLGVDYESLKEAGAFRLMGPREIKAAGAQGADIQLHTHRHHLPVDRTVVMKEIAENRSYLEPLVRRKLVHFCYPSGVWDRDQWEWLNELNIKSATTCRIGFNDSSTPLLALNRYLDNNTITTNEFVSEISGANDFIRSMRKRLKFGR